MSTRCPACGEFIGDNTFGKSPLHKCGAAINWNAVELASTDPRDAEIAALRVELARKDAALKIYQARAHRNANSTCDGCPFAVAERDVNWADRDEGYYTCGLDNKERWGEDPACPDVLYKEPSCQTA